MEETDSLLRRKVHGPKMRISGFPAMEPLCNALASHAATTVRKVMRTGLDVTVYGYEVLRHGDYLKSLHAPSALYLINFPFSGATGVIKAHPRLLGKVLDMSLGGDGSIEQSGKTRDLTSIDLAIYGQFVDLVCMAFDDSIRELCGRSAIGTPERGRFEEQPGMVRLTADRAEIFVIKLNFHIADDRRGAGMDFVMPVSGLEPLKRDLASTTMINDPTLRKWERSMQDHVLDLPLKADGVVGIGQYTVGELSRLKPGMLVELPPEAIEQIELRVETVNGAVALGHGKLGIKGRQKALRLQGYPNADFLRPLLEKVGSVPDASPDGIDPMAVPSETTGGAPPR